MIVWLKIVLGRALKTNRLRLEQGMSEIQGSAKSPYEHWSGNLRQLDSRAFQSQSSWSYLPLHTKWDLTWECCTAVSCIGRWFRQRQFRFYVAFGPDCRHADPRQISLQCCPTCLGPRYSHCCESTRCAQTSGVSATLLSSFRALLAIEMRGVVNELVISGNSGQQSLTFVSQCRHFRWTEQEC